VEAARWRDEARDLLNGLGAAFDRQFERWALSPAEKEVALLLLKGLSHKELAEVRSITEATARQQARAVYKKAGLSGRHDLAAFFLEDLLLPSGGETRRTKCPSAERRSTQVVNLRVRDTHPRLWNDARQCRSGVSARRTSTSRSTYFHSSVARSM
jgi:DNA-binding CsgD family transcriptional regulator